MKCACIICGEPGNVMQATCFLCPEHWKWVRPETAKAYRAAMTALGKCRRDTPGRKRDKLWTEAVALFSDCKDEARAYREGDLFRRAG